MCEETTQDHTTLQACQLTIQWVVHRHQIQHSSKTHRRGCMLHQSLLKVEGGRKGVDPLLPWTDDKKTRTSGQNQERVTKEVAKGPKRKEEVALLRSSELRRKQVLNGKGAKGSE